MFKENLIYHKHKHGSIEVVCGSMFSGKTEELIRRLRRAQFAKQKVEIFKPSLDKRYDEVNVVSHNSNAIHSTPVDFATQILLYVGDAEVIGIDEAQFFDNELVNVCKTLASNGVRVIIAGLDMDFLGNPFGPMPSLMAIAEQVTKVQAICVSCGNLATFSHRKTTADEIVVLGETDVYEPLCRCCYNEAVKIN